MNLLTRYATVTGLEPRRQWAVESFYPLPITKYITLHASSGMAAKNYPHYDDVVRLIGHILNSQGIQIVQLGGKDEAAVPGCVHLQGKTDYHQSLYILKGSLLQLGNDSWTAHRAGAISLPLITLFSSTTAANHGAAIHNPEKTSFIESHRWGRQATFAAQENPASIALIPPERVATEVLKLLGIQHTFPQQTRFQGLLAKATVLDCVPNGVPAPTFFPELPLNIRMDWEHNEQVLGQILSTGRKVNLIVNHPIDPGLLQHFKAQILSYTHELGAPASPLPLPALEYIGTIKGLFPRHAFFTREQDAVKVAELRFQYLDHSLVEQVKDPNREDYIRETLTYLNREDTAAARVDLKSEITQNQGNLTFRTNRYILASGSIFLSYPHLRLNQPITNLADNTAAVIDDPLFFRDLNHVTISYTPNPVQA